MKCNCKLRIPSYLCLDSYSEHRNLGLDNINLEDMWDSIFSYFSEKYPFIIFLVFVGIIVWRVAKFYYGRIPYIETQVKNHEDILKDSHCKAHLDSKDKNDKDISDIKNSLEYLRGKMDVLSSARSSLVQSNSPLSLNTKGLQVAEEINAEGIIKRNWDRILLTLESVSFNSNAYDIQQYCIEKAFVESNNFFCEEDILLLKNVAFQQGSPLQSYTELMGILIRDAYLKHKDIALTEIDRHDPRKQESVSSDDEPIE